MTRKKKNNSSKIIARGIHVFITLAILVDILACKTVMHKRLIELDLFLPILYIGLVVVTIVLYFIVSCMDPGYVREGDPDVKPLEILEESDTERNYDAINEDGNSSSDNRDVQRRLLNDDVYVSMEEGKYKFNLKKKDRCGLCALQRPLRARHCRECRHCVRKFDHHCPWISNCVGERNHRWFWLFLFTEVILMSWSIQISITGFTNNGAAGSSWVKDNVLLLIADVTMGVLLLVTVSLWFIHTYMLLSNNTTWESVSRHRITYLKKLDSEENPFNMGICRNIYTFFCYCQPYDWRKIYNKMTQLNPDYDSADSTIDDTTENKTFET